MADQSRQIKLAAAKKKLKEFQQKSTQSPVNPGPKKKRKVKGGGQGDAQSADRHSPEHDHGELGARESPISEMQEDSGEHGRCSPVSNLHAATNTECLTDSAGLQENCELDANGDEHSLEENRPLSSTESLRQLSQQLNGLLAESPSSYVNGETGSSPVNEKELETRNQELAAALDSSTLKNSQLTAKIETLTKQSQELSEQMQKERKDFEQKFAKEQGAMREQLQVHIQTIGILVSEKSELQTALSFTQQAARQKTGEAEELNNRLHASKQRVSELERTLSTVSTQQKQFEKHNKELEKDRDSLRLEIFRLNNANEEMKQQSSELAEQLKLKASESRALGLERDELRKRLEMADVMLQQFSSQSGAPSEHQQVQLLLEEKHQLEVHTAQLMESVAQLQRERDQYAEQIQEEGRVWKDKTEQLLTQVTLMSEERDRSASRIQELQEQITELKKAAALLSQEQESQATSQSAGPSEKELALEESIHTLQQERDALSLQYQAQVRDNEQLSRLVQEQETRLEELEMQARRAADEAQDKLRILEDVQSDKATISRALAQNRELKDQLAELQNGFVKLTNENMELTSALQSEQHVKKEIARKMGQLQEDLHNAKEQMKERMQECSSLQEQRDQYLAHLQQYSTGYQQLVSEREHLHKQFLQQTQLMDRLQHDEVQGKVQLEQSQLQLQEAQERLDQLAKDNEHLKTEVQELLNSSSLNTSLRDQGDGVESYFLPETFQKSTIAIPEDFESREEMEEFLHTALSRLEEERDEIMRRLEEERRLHQAALQQVATTSHEHHHHSTCSETGSTDSVPVEVHEGLRGAMEKLQERFTGLMQEKVDLKERVEELEHRCIQLSGETDTIGEYIALYQNQRAIMKQRHTEKEEYISRLARDKEEMKTKLAELQDLVMRLVGERNEWYTRYMSAIHNPDFTPAGEDAVPPAGTHLELDAVDGPVSMDTSIAVDVAPDVQTRTDEGPQDRLDPPAGSSLRPREDGTARQIMQLLQEMQNPESQPPPFLGENPCIPFFYRPDENDEVKIMVI
ncbi:golgin subfamily A member 2 isoform X1 [Ictalurus furcatus]|uniref:golgin subfamily A member 2 isoform X1 n=1 Tax=Ictalurus furcatus TaxID=66913 RepID=UPI002350D58A|nr:golgin subfamily A member 2 isoform X1 [Ictalurus furcatus]XP_053473484.1 golgin subfamily A member 2 isoform X1 [Ictalurus furcatus]